LVDYQLIRSAFVHAAMSLVAYHCTRCGRTKFLRILLAMRLFELSAVSDILCKV